DIPLSVLKDVIKSDESGNYDYKRYFLFEEDDEDEEENNEDEVYCEYNDRYYHINDVIYVKDYGYVLSDDVEEVAVQIDDTWYNKDNCVQCEISEEWMMKGDEQVLPDGRKVTQDEYDNWMA
ncbi:MAG: hypothetical protein ACK5XN_29640, partial [Bacteroidota bacterium]